MNELILGCRYFVSGFSLIFLPGLRRFVVIPLLINIIVFIILFLLMQHLVSEFNTWFVALLPSWLQWLSWILWILFIASFFLFFVYAFVTIANIIAAPFNSFLSEKVELHLTGRGSENRSLLDNIKDVPRIIGRQLAILGYYLPRAVGILILFFIPMLHLLAPILWVIFNAWYFTLTYIDYPTDNHRIPISRVREHLQEHRMLALGFGGAALVASSIPILNFFTIPAAVAGATKLWCEWSE